MFEYIIYILNKTFGNETDNHSQQNICLCKQKKSHKYNIQVLKSMYVKLS